MATSRSFGGRVVDDALADADFTGGDVFQACDHPQQGRFAAAGGTDQHDELAIAYRNVDAMDDVCRAEGLSYVADRDRSHSLLPDRGSGSSAVLLVLGTIRTDVPPWNTRAEQIIGLSPAEKQARLAVGDGHSGGQIAAKAPCRHRRGAVGP